MIERPRQAIILAGGRGTRLGELTAHRPKAMVEIHGKPFLAYLVEMLREQGFQRLLLLLGYLPEVIQDYFKDGRDWGIKIEYSVTQPDDLTCHRMKVAKSMIEPCFLLMYCDNYWPLQMNKMWEKFVAAKVPAMTTVYSNKDKYSKDRVLVGKDDCIEIFDRAPTTPGLQGVEISYAILMKEVLDLMPQQDELFEQAVYPSLVKQRKLLAYVTDHRYYSVGSAERLPLTQSFLSRDPTIILDRDGVLNKKPQKAEYVRKWEEFEWLPGAKESLRLFAKAGYRTIIVSNQAGIARQEMSEEDLLRIHDRMQIEVLRAEGRIDQIYYCKHGWDEGCDCRKPKPGMLFQAQRDFSLDLTRTVFIGDDDRDGQAAAAAGCPYFQVNDEISLLDITNKLLGSS